jgi:hypothetical protein
MKTLKLYSLNELYEKNNFEEFYAINIQGNIELIIKPMYAKTKFQHEQIYPYTKKGYRINATLQRWKIINCKKYRKELHDIVVLQMARNIAFKNCDMDKYYIIKAQLFELHHKLKELIGHI